MDLTTIYMLGFIITVAAFAIRAGDVEARPLFVIAMCWPVSWTGIVVILVWDLFGWQIDVQSSPKMFGYRKATNPAVRGVAVTVFGIEMQMYSFRKKA